MLPRATPGQTWRRKTSGHLGGPSGATIGKLQMVENKGNLAQAVATAAGHWEMLAWADLILTFRGGSPLGPIGARNGSEFPRRTSAAWSRVFGGGLPGPYLGL